VSHGTASLGLEPGLAKPRGQFCRDDIDDLNEDELDALRLLATKFRIGKRAAKAIGVRREDLVNLKAWLYELYGVKLNELQACPTDRSKGSNSTSLGNGRCAGFTPGGR